MATLNADIRADADGSIVVMTPLTEDGRVWMKMKVDSEPWQWYAGGLCVEHRFAADLVTYARQDGLTVSTANFYVMEA